jgi:hypothetical protein
MESITTQQLAVVLFALTSAIVNPVAGETEVAGVEVAVGVEVVGAVVPVEVPGVFGFAEVLVGDGLSVPPADVPDAPSSPGVAVLS